MLMSAPTAAASDGVASPNRIAPSTETISNASGRNDVASAQITVPSGTLVSSGGSFGASAGLMIARAIA